MKSEEKLLLSFVSLMFLVFASVVINVDVGVTENGTYFHVVPPEVKDITPPDEFRININITGAPPTYAWEIILNWEPALLNVSYIDEGDFLHRWKWIPIPPPGKWVPAYETGFPYTPFDDANLKGNIRIGCVLIGELPQDEWASGNGWLCTLGFKVKTYGTCVLNLSDTQLADHLGGDGKPAYTYYPNQDGFFTNKHDIAITDVTCNSTTVRVGQVVAVNVTATNEGGFAETFNVTAYYNDTSIQEQTDITLDAGASTTLTFPWNTTYAAAGVYTIKANASQVPKEINLTNNLYTNGVVAVTLPGYPIADFTYSPKNPLVDEVATFNSTSYDEPPGHIVNWEWDFNSDGTIDATTENATWTYTEYGQFIIKLTVEDNEGLKSIPKEQPITVYALPKASFDYSPKRPLINDKITFNASLSTANGGTIVSYKWDFGDDTTVLYTGENLTTITTHQYNTFGTYSVNLTVTDSENLKDSTSETIKVVAQPIAGRFTFSPSDPMRNELITFNASTSRDVDGTIVSYKWDFGDGTTKTYVGANLTVATTHTYVELLPDDEPFHVTLNVTDDDGLSDTYGLWIPVLPIHDIAVTDITPSTNTATIGDALSIDVTFKNVGDKQLTDENLPFNVTIYYDETKIQTLAATEKLAPNDSHTLSFTWNTTNMNPNTYRIKAVVETKTRDLNTTNNELTSSEVTLKTGGTGEETSTIPDILLYVIIAVIILVVAAAIVIYFRKFRKK